VERDRQEIARRIRRHVSTANTIETSAIDSPSSFTKKAFGLSVFTEDMMRWRAEIAIEFFAIASVFPSAKKVLQELQG
jgi:hypothetical protein